MKIQNKEYRLVDFLSIPFKISSGMTSLLVVNNIINALIPTLLVILSAKFVDTSLSIINGNDTKSTLLPLILKIIVLISYQYISYAFINLVETKLKMKLTELFRVAIVQKRARLKYYHMENHETWDLLQRVSNEPAEKIFEGLSILFRMIGILIRVSSLLLVLSTQVWWSSLVILLFSVPLFWLAVKSGKETYQASRNVAVYSRRANYLQKILTTRDTVDERFLFGYSEALNSRWKDEFNTVLKVELRTQSNKFIRMKSASFITVLVSVLISATLIEPLGSGKITIGMFMSFVTTSHGLTDLLSWQLTFITSRLAENREYLKDLSLFSKLDETVGAIDLPINNIDHINCIEFKNVSFAYPNTNKYILKNISFKIFEKKHYALVGVNGAGKTTITKLLCGFYDNYTGEIFIDGKNLRSFDQSELKGLFSVVYQDFAKYEITLRDSIGLGNSKLKGDEEIMESLSILGIDNIVKKLPKGLDTSLGKIQSDSVDLSGGEWQRIAIASSLLSSSPVKILDEPTAALDPVSESNLYKLFDEISKGKTTIFITHRLGAARLADEILVIDGGCVIEKGNHKELMDYGGAYAKMFESQKGWYD